MQEKLSQLLPESPHANPYCYSCVLPVNSVIKASSQKMISVLTRGSISPMKNVILIAVSCVERGKFSLPLFVYGMFP